MATSKTVPTTIKRSRGRPPKPPRVKANPRRNGEFDILGLGEPIPTGLLNKHEADERMWEEILLRRDGRTRVNRNVPLRDVIEEFGSVARQGSLKHLRAFWSNVPLSLITRDACWAYVDWRAEGTDQTENSEPPMDSTVHNELGNLQNIVNRYCAYHQISPAPTVYLPTLRPQPREFLRAHEVDRLMKAAEGRIWNPDTNDWRYIRGGNLELKNEAWRTEVWPMRRMIELCIWTGTRADAVRRATWTRRGDRPYIDLRIDVFFRRGPEEKQTKKARPPVPLVPRLSILAQEWFADDAAIGCDYVIHDTLGKPIGEDTWRLFSLVREAAGLPEGVTLRTLRASCAVWMMANGCTPEQTAEFLGNTARVISRFYDRYAVEFSHAAADALDSRSYSCSLNYKKEIQAANEERPDHRRDETVRFECESDGLDSLSPK